MAVDSVMFCESALLIILVLFLQTTDVQHYPIIQILLIILLPYSHLAKYDFHYCMYHNQLPKYQQFHILIALLDENQILLSTRVIVMKLMEMQSLHAGRTKTEEVLITPLDQSYL